MQGKLGCVPDVALSSGCPRKDRQKRRESSARTSIKAKTPGSMRSLQNLPKCRGFFQPKQANHNQNTKAQTGETKPKPTHSLQAPANAEQNEPSQTGLDGKEHRSSCSLGEAWGLQTRQPKPKSEPFDAKTKPKPKAPAKPRAKVKPDANQAKLKF